MGVATAIAAPILAAAMSKEVPVVILAIWLIAVGGGAGPARPSTSSVGSTRQREIDDMDYWILTAQSKEGGVIDCYPAGSPDGYLFNEALPLLDQFPSDAFLQFSRNFPQFRKLEDFQRNTLGALIVSPKVRRLLDGHRATNAEFLPVAVKDHKGEVIAPDYAILNLLGSEAAIDLEASTVEMNDLDQDQVWSIERLVLDRGSISPEARIFRCTARRRLYMIRDDLKEAFEKAALTGYRLFPADNWNGEDY